MDEHDFARFGGIDEMLFRTGADVIVSFDHLEPLVFAWLASPRAGQVGGKRECGIYLYGDCGSDDGCLSA